MRRRLLALFCACALAAAGAAQTVYAAETVSGDDVSITSTDVVTVSDGNAPFLVSADIETVSGGNALVVSAPTVTIPYTAYDSYYGSISTSYLEFMRGYLAKLPSDAHYVAARVSQYDYIFAYGDELEWTGSEFTGAATVARWNTYNYGSFSVAYDGSFSLDAGSALVYSDLTDRYPSLATSSDMTLRQLLILLTIFCICLTVDHMYQVRKIRRITRREG